MVELMFLKELMLIREVSQKSFINIDFGCISKNEAINLPKSTDLIEKVEDYETYKFIITDKND